MPSTTLAITHALNALLMIALPIGLGIFLTRRFRLPWRLWWIGAATFILSQVFHLPFNSLLSNLIRQGIIPVPLMPVQERLVTAVIFGLSAGVFEEVTRYLVLRFWARDARSWHKGILFGAGHGGVEGFILGALVALTYIQIIALSGADLAAVVPPEQLEAARQGLQTYWSIPWYLSLTGFVERLFALPIHIACAVLVLQVFTRRQIRWLWLAIGWHALIDAVGPGILAPAYGIYITEAFIGLVALASLGIIHALRQPEPVEPDEELAPLPAPIQPGEIEITAEKLADTRYQ